ncbi:16S rRNA (cytosine(1402)-N(4))-methyltransferase RsmH [Candidatus Daviesbacteria bacterium]|nr:16S rRNA (cytosine(1402)-N(4))-methyltransferase RsmH [Candidatus Daviesbacteria bacterium]
MEGYHKSVLLSEVLEYLEVKQGRWYVDCTLGDGGHSLGILKRGGKIIGIDTDQEALDRASGRFKQEGIEQDNFKLVKGNFRDLKQILKQTDTDQIILAGILFDFGVSSLQLESPERGFSFNSEGPLDMRMDKNLAVTAADLVNGLNKGELYELFSKLGEERFARPLAEAIVGTRAITKFNTTKQLADLVTGVYRRFGIKNTKIHPATKVFQALRMAVNDELGVIRDGLGQVSEVIGSSGRIVTISFHSLEDRIVKNTFKEWQEQGLGQIVIKRPVVPNEDEVIKNPRSRSAKLRAFEKR